MATQQSMDERRVDEVRDLVSAGASERMVLRRIAGVLSADTATLFLLDSSGRALRSAPNVWDWTRGQFRVALELWPSVKEAIDLRRPILLTKSSARSLELDWFDPSGVQASICAPLLGEHGPVGVLFVDYRLKPASSDPGLLGWAMDLAHELAREHELELGERPPTRVEHLMSRELIVIDADVTASVADRVARTGGVHHLLAVHDGHLRGVLCRCDLHGAWPRARVADIMHREVVSAAPEDAAEDAARTMVRRGVGCLPVLGASGEILGVLTRRDLRETGWLAARPGEDACAACGSTHGLSPADPDHPALCAACLTAPPREATLDPYYSESDGVG